MEKSDLKTGWRAETRNCGMFIVMIGSFNLQRYGTGANLLCNRGGFMVVNDYENDLLFKSDSGYDIIKIYDSPSNTNPSLMLNPDTKGSLLWERKEAKKMTVSEIVKELGYEIEIVK